MTPVIKADLWLSIFGLPPEGTFVIIDSRLVESYGQLRALPLLRRLGIINFTFTSSWRGLEIVPYQYRVINEQTIVDNLIDDFPIAQFISQRTADRSMSDASRKLLMAQQEREDSPLLVFVLESERFMLPDSLGTKSFVDEYDLKNVYAYEKIFTNFCRQKGYPPPAMSADRSLNLMLHHLAWTIGDQTLLTRLANLFDYTRIPPTSWGWELLRQLCIQPNIRQDDRVIQQLLRPWIDSDFTRVCSRLLATLQQFDFDPDLVTKEQERLTAGA